MSKVLITGGSGMVGQRLTRLLLQNGHKVVHLGRKPGILPEGVKVFGWDYTRDYIDEQALEGVEVIVHLAGAGVAESRWTTARKKEIIDSRVKTAALLYRALSKGGHTVNTFVGAAAVGWYGDGNETWQKEDDPQGSGFLAETCRVWEEATSRFTDLGLRVCRLRIGVVLSTEGGALPQMDRPIRLGIGAYLGNGRQYVPWIHIDDVCGIFMKAIEDENMQDVYNTVAPGPVTAKELSRNIAKALGKVFLPVPGPAFALRLAMGEMADMVLFSNRASADKIIAAGYVFRFPQLLPALHDLYRK